LVDTQVVDPGKIFLLLFLFSSFFCVKKKFRKEFEGELATSSSSSEAHFNQSSSASDQKLPPALSVFANRLGKLGRLVQLFDSLYGGSDPAQCKRCIWHPFEE